MKGTTTNDIIISDLPDDVIAALDAIAERVAMTREDFISAIIEREVSRPVAPVTVADLKRFAMLTRDARDPSVMKDAWR